MILRAKGVFEGTRFRDSVISFLERVRYSGVLRSCEDCKTIRLKGVGQ